MTSYIATVTLNRAQYIPIFIPESTSIRVFKKIFGNNWRELDRVDLSEGSSPDTYSYDDQIYAILFNPILIGNTLEIRYDHSNVPNPGVVDLLPAWMADQASYNYNRVLSGLYLLNTTMAGTIECGNKYNISLDGGLVRLGGKIYSVGSTYWDLHYFGGSSGDNIVTTTLFYLTTPELSDTQKRTRFIASPRYIRSSQYAFNAGRGVSDSLTELNGSLDTMLTRYNTTEFIELLKVTLISQKILPPEIHTHYEPRFRVTPDL